MRRSLVTLTLTAAAASAALVGCDEGPSQPFSPAPPNAGNIWNNGNVDASVEQGSAPLDAGFPTVNLLLGCPPDVQRQVWSKMLTQPLTATAWAGITFVGAPGGDIGNPDAGINWAGASMNKAQTINCNAVPLGAATCPSGNGTCYNGYWGYDQEVGVSWNTQTNLIDQMTIITGYTGDFRLTSQTASPDGWMVPGDVFSFIIGQQPKRWHAGQTKEDGVPFEIPWGGPVPNESSGGLNVQLSDLFVAGMDTFAVDIGYPWVPGVTGVGYDCVGSGTCLAEGNAGGVSYFGIRPISFYLVFYGNTVQPVESTPNTLYNFFVKAEPYSHMPQVLKLDPEGPIATQDLLATVDDGGVTPSGTPCTQKIGLPYGSATQPGTLLHDCVDTSPVASVNTSNMQKLLGGLSHDYEHYTFNVVGINQNMTANSLPWNKVVMDTDLPTATDTAQDWTFDVRTDAHTWNDYQQYYGNDIEQGNGLGNTDFGMLDEKGIAMVYVEWANLMLADIHTQLVAANWPGVGAKPHTLGDPACVGGGSPAADCSGIEGLMIPIGQVFDPNGQPVPQLFTNGSTIDDPLIPNQTGGGLNLAYDLFNFYGDYALETLGPGDHVVEFCDQPAFGNCPDLVGEGISPYLTALYHVTRVLGKGNALALPSELQDRRYYYKWFAIAYIKYMRAFGTMWQADVTANPTHTDPSINQAVQPCVPNNPGLTGPFAVAGANVAAKGLCPTDVDNTTIDLEALFYDNIQGNSFDVFEYVDRSFMDTTGTPPQPGSNAPASLNYHPWDFSYGDDLVGGNQRYDTFYQRMDREEIAIYTAMLLTKTDPPGFEDNVTLTNLFGSPVIAGMYPSAGCALGAGDPTAMGCPTNPPLQIAGASSCPAGQLNVQAASHINGGTSLCGLPCPTVTNAANGGACPDPNFACVSAGGAAANPNSSNGLFCVNPANPGPACSDGHICKGANAGWSCVSTTGSAGTSFVCVNPADAATATDATGACNGATNTQLASAIPQVACVPMYLDLNGQQQSVSKQPDGGTGWTPSPRPFLHRYLAAAGGSTVFSMGHSPMQELQSNENPGLGVTTVTVPNLVNPYVSEAPYPADDAGCADPLGLGDLPDPDYNGLCFPPQDPSTQLIGSTVNPTATGALQVTVPFYSLQYSQANGSGLAIPDPTPNTMRNYIYPAAQLLFNGVLENYQWFYEPYVDLNTQPTCNEGQTCADGFTCNSYGNCVDKNGTIIIDGVYADDFIGELFLCEDPTTQDILHVRMYDSASTIVQWLENHPGTQPVLNDPESGSAQWACGIVLRYSPYGNYLDYIISENNGVMLQINPGQGQGRVVGAELYNPALSANATQ